MAYLQNLHAHAEAPARRVDLLPPVHPEVVGAMHGLLGEVVREWSRARGSHTKVEGHHRRPFEAIGLELQRTLERSLLDSRGRLGSALAVAASAALGGLLRGHRNHEAE